jgi:hypothetical protein
MPNGCARREGTVVDGVRDVLCVRKEGIVIQRGEFRTHLPVGGSADTPFASVFG